MSKHKLVWWEDNGYHDSYFYGVYFDTADGLLHKTDLGATAYAGGIGFGSEFELPTPEVLELARQQLACSIFAFLRRDEDADVLTPGPHNVKKGRAFRLLAPHSFYVKEAGECPKCGGTGKWVNPRNADDKRPCFACNGTGKVPGKGAFKKGADGKRERVTLAAGTVVVSIKDDVNFFGTTYRNGYNKVSRFNSSISVKHGDVLVRIPLEKLRQDAEPATDAELMDRADELSYSHQYGSAYGCKAWTTQNWAAELAKATGKDFRPKPCPTGAAAA